MKGDDDMTDFLDGIADFLTAEEEAEITRQFVKDNFCPFDEDPFAYEYEGMNLFDEFVY